MAIVEIDNLCRYEVKQEVGRGDVKTPTGGFYTYSPKIYNPRSRWFSVVHIEHDKKLRTYTRIVRI